MFKALSFGELAQERAKAYRDLQATPDGLASLQKGLEEAKGKIEPEKVLKAKVRKDLTLLQECVCIDLT